MFGSWAGSTIHRAMLGRSHSPHVNVLARSYIAMKVRISPTYRHVLLKLAEDPYRRWTAGELCRAIGLGPASIIPLLSRMRNEELVTVASEGAGGSKYWLSDQGYKRAQQLSKERPPVRLPHQSARASNHADHDENQVE
jgi:hypothetical protein